MNSNNFLQLTSCYDAAMTAVSTTNRQKHEKLEIQLKLAQFTDYVKRKAKLLISFKQDDYNYLYALQNTNLKNIENRKDCFIASSSKLVQTKTVYREDNSLSNFLQVNFQNIEKIRYVEKFNLLLCSVEVTDQKLALPVGLNLDWLTHREVDKCLQVEDKEDYQALLLKI